MIKRSVKKLVSPWRVATIARDASLDLGMTVQFVMNLCTRSIPRSWLSVNSAGTLYTQSVSNSVGVLHFQVWPLTCFVSGAKATSNPTCVFCRARWTVPGSAAVESSGSKFSRGYLNLGNVAGLSTVRDTSSCECFDFYIFT
jgi:hypothetical protein